MKRFLHDVQTHLLTGVSYMIPFVVPGGILIAIGFLLGGIKVYETPGFAAELFFLGKDAFGLMVAALAGYIAYSVADRPGIAPGFVGGIVATRIGAGFLGGMIAGLIAGYLVEAIKQIKVPQMIRSLMPVLIIPLLASTIVGLLMVYFIGPPVKWLNETMSVILNNLGTGSAIALGLLIGAMMAFDMGGPVNKAAYFFALGVAETANNWVPMGAVFVGGMVPPLVIAVAMLIANNKFTEEEKAGIPGCFVGAASLITEFAIPYAAGDPVRVMPSIMVGSAVGGAISMALGVSMMAPHGGLFVFALSNKPLLYVLSIIVGGIVGGLMLAAIKPKLEAEKVELDGQSA
ncbi:PTS sugar transporter [Ornatilinea apprima]|uniref:PTS sugar transporter n=1 Tax=Ornatilinea apprima TaxID=1134406 RepID=A0A0P6YA16_9CHLR|nr:PTS fructose transporter subunit IIC [Ornatilinea apprima]KPL78659.1 PTS sugar transporter [Ornatilinea apprima]